MDIDGSRARIVRALEEHYKEWPIPINAPTENPTTRDSSTRLSEERVGIACLNVFLLFLASDLRLPSAIDLSKIVAGVFAFA